MPQETSLSRLWPQATSTRQAPRAQHATHAMPFEVVQKHVSNPFMKLNLVVVLTLFNFTIFGRFLLVKHSVERNGLSFDQCFMDSSCSSSRRRTTTWNTTWPRPSQRAFMNDTLSFWLSERHRVGSLVSPGFGPSPVPRVMANHLWPRLRRSMNLMFCSFLIVLHITRNAWDTPSYSVDKGFIQPHLGMSASKLKSCESHGLLTFIASGAVLTGCKLSTSRLPCS